MKKIISFILKIGVSLALLIFLFFRIDLGKVFYLTCAVLLFMFLVFMGALRWSMLLGSFKNSISFYRILVSFGAGLFFNVCLPSSLGGDALRCVDLSIETKDSSYVFTTVVLDRIFGLLGLTIVALAGFSWGYFNGIIKDIKLLLAIITLAVFLIAVFTLIFNKRLFAFIDNKLALKVKNNFLGKAYKYFHVY